MFSLGITLFELIYGEQFYPFYPDNFNDNKEEAFKKMSSLT